jgi:dienelactone hydrolase
VKVEKEVLVGKAGDIELHAHGFGALSRRRICLREQGHTCQQAGADHGSWLRVRCGAVYLTSIAKWSSQIEDAKTHIRWVRTNASSLGIDPKRIGVVGYSAGGHIALFTAGQSDAEVTACVSFYPQTDVRNIVQALMPPGSDENLINDASPITHIKAGYPPTIIFQGLLDVTIPPEKQRAPVAGASQSQSFIRIAHIGGCSARV